MRNGQHHWNTIKSYNFQNGEVAHRRVSLVDVKKNVQISILTKNAALFAMNNVFNLFFREFSSLSCGWIILTYKLMQLTTQKTSKLGRISFCIKFTGFGRHMMRIGLRELSNGSIVSARQTLETCNLESAVLRKEFKLLQLEKAGSEFYLHRCAETKYSFLDDSVLKKYLFARQATKKQFTQNCKQSLIYF